MKKKFYNALFICAMLVSVSFIFVSCDKEEPTPPADLTAINAEIATCEALLADATTDDYPADAITAFQAVVTTAKTAIADTGIKQSAVDNLVVQLEQARATFLAAAYGAIPVENLIMGLSFDEGSGTQLTTTGKAWTAVLTAGSSEIFGTNTGLPTFVEGKKGKAMCFAKGSHLQISNYTKSDLIGKQLSIAVWVNPDSTRAGNYIMSYNYWNSWKFQLQEQNKPFFTVHTNEDGWVDADNQSDFSAPNNTWTHLVVTMNLDAQTLNFYVNGESTMEWTVDSKEGLHGTGVWEYKNTLPLLIGSCTTYAEAVAEWDWDWAKTPEAWDHFVGMLDELKVYNIALTDGQVAKLYKDEGGE